MRREEKYVLKDVCLTVYYGDFLAITGPNGGGKTTLLRIILGLLAPTHGSVSFYAPDSPHVALATPPAFGYLPQKNTIDSHFPVSVEEVIASGLLAEKSLSKAEKAARVEDTLVLTGLADLRTRPIGRLSGGQLQRALFGRAIIRKPQILVLDEPLSYIDKHFETRMYDIIRDLSGHTTILLVSHEMSAIGAMAGRHIIVDRHLTECTAHHHYFPPECGSADNLP